MLARFHHLTVFGPSHRANHGLITVAFDCLAKLNVDIGGVLGKCLTFSVDLGQAWIIDIYLGRINENILLINVW